MKLIHSGKVLRDEQTVEECNMKPSDFLVCMITKAKKPAAPAPAAEEATTPSATAPTTTTSAPAPSSTSSAVEATPVAADAVAATTTMQQQQQPEFPPEVVASLTAMGFPEAEARACLVASRGNPDVAVEFLMNGIPPHLEQTTTQAAVPSSSQPLQALREHPQFDALRRLVQHNPAMLQAVLAQIGQQQPDLLAQINENPALFIEMMNEPIAPVTATAPSAVPALGSSDATTTRNAGLGNIPGLADPTQMVQMIANLSPAELNEMATMMGLTSQQLQATAQMIGQMQPEQLQDFMMQAAQQGGGVNNNALFGGGGGAPGQPQFLRLTEEEMASIDRLVDMGFDRAEATQAYLACDKNEALAANLLMDGGFAFEDDMMGGGGGDEDADNNDDMYD